MFTDIIMAELAIPLLALGSLYIFSNHRSTPPESFTSKESFTNLKQNDKLPNMNIPPQNYPSTSNSQLTDVTDRYPNPDQATSTYLNQNDYELKVKDGLRMGDNIPNIYGMHGNYMTSREFTHNNQVPFTGSKPKGQVYNNSYVENILDSYSGAGSQIIKKEAQAPLFAPQSNIQWANGTPNVTEFLLSRENPSLKNNNVKPFESVNVGPGLDQGYGTQGSLGFNSGMEARDKWLDRNVDELRVKTNPKPSFTLEGHQGPAQSSVKNLGMEGQVQKYRPDGYFMNTQDRWLTTTGAEKGQRLVADEQLCNTQRNESNAAGSWQMGTPSATMKNASYTPIEFEDSKRIAADPNNFFSQIGPSNASGHGQQFKDQSKQSYLHYNNNRSVSADNNAFFGSGFSSAVGAVIAPILDIVKPNKRSDVSENIRI